MPERAIIVVPLAVFIVLAVFFSLAYLVTVALHIPLQLGFQLPVRFIGLLLLISGLTLLGWFFRYRRPVDILLSTYVTFSKFATRGESLGERSGRIEPLIVEGPYKYVRHPLYSDVVLLILGWWLLLDYSFLLISSLLLLLWFNFVVAPFEERELRAIFGADYDRYAERVPRIIPFAGRPRRILEDRHTRS